MTGTLTDLTPERLSAIAARCEAATAGPWEVDHDRDHEANRGVPYIHDTRGHGVMYPDDETELEDIEFSAHARQDVPDLLAALRERDERQADATAHILGLEDTLAEQDERVAILEGERDAALDRIAILEAALREIEDEREQFRQHFAPGAASEVKDG